MGLSRNLVLLAVLSTHLPSSVYGAMSMNSDILAMMSGCGHNVNLVSSVEYAKINVEMHHGMAINFTGNAEYDFLAGMIPHHTAAVDMCKVYEDHAEASGFSNPGIDSLCSNITFGAESWGEWQYDFSQPGETEQMLDILEDIGMIDHYNEGCSGNMHGGMDEGMHGDTNGGMRRDLVEGMHGDMHGDTHSQHHDMFMGCGKLDLDQTKDYIQTNMDMHMRMSFNWTGNPGVDFLLGMIPHHQGGEYVILILS
mmetsp:Transcript_24418/g.35451  ORF Transcript_24418/g.35451 Transcript_24418/m.35451 type:complete len:253 (-) Transcript_24418:618-1376(-)